MPMLDRCGADPARTERRSGSRDAVRLLDRPQLGRIRVRGQRRRQLREVLVQPARRHHQQRRRRTTHRPEHVRQVARQEHKRPGPGLEPVLAALYVQGPREDVEALVLAAVGVPGRPTVDGGLDHGEAAAGRPAGRLHVGSPAGHALTWADDVSTGDGLVGHSGLLDRFRRLSARYIASPCRRARIHPKLRHTTRRDYRKLLGRGHTTASITTDTYGHLIRSELEELAGRLEQALVQRCSPTARTSRGHPRRNRWSQARRKWDSNPPPPYFISR